MTTLSNKGDSPPSFRELCSLRWWHLAQVPSPLVLIHQKKILYTYGKKAHQWLAAKHSSLDLFLDNSQANLTVYYIFNNRIWSIPNYCVKEMRSKQDSLIHYGFTKPLIVHKGRFQAFFIIKALKIQIFFKQFYYFLYKTSQRCLIFVRFAPRRWLFLGRT